MVITVLFWVLWLLWILGFFIPLPGNTGKYHSIVGVILIGILGWRVLGNPLEK